MSTVGVICAGERSAREIAAWSRAALDRPMAHDAELWVAIARDEASERIAGAFGRGAGARRGSGGPEVVVGPATVHVALSLAHPGALSSACDEKRIVNRYVRPLLRALTRVGAQAHYFGRDWIAVQHRPAAQVVFAHDAATRRTLFEAFVAVRAPFAGEHRASFLGKPHGTLESITGRSFDAARIADAIVDAYVAPHASIPLPTPVLFSSFESAADPPWLATREEAIGIVGAGPDARGVFRVGGDLLVSRDALASLESRVASCAGEDVARFVDDTLAAPGVALDGVRSLASVRDVILDARRAYGNLT